MGFTLKVSMGGMVGRKKLSEPEKMLVWYEDAFERERVCFEHEDDAYVRAKNFARNGHWNYFQNFVVKLQSFTPSGTLPQPGSLPSMASLLERCQAREG